MTAYDSATFESSIYDEKYGAYAIKENVVKWDEQSYISDTLIAKWHCFAETTASELIAKWNEQSYINRPLIAKWNLQSYIDNTLTAKWDTRVWLSAVELIAKWDEINYVNLELIAKWDSQPYVLSQIIPKWDEQSYINEEIIAKWDSQIYTSPQETIIKWNEQSYIDNTLISKWNEQSYIDNTLISKWNEQSYIDQTLISKWDSRTYVDDTLIVKWDTRIWVDPSELIVKWAEGPAIPFPLVNYLEVTTIQGATMYPVVYGGNIDKEYGVIGEMKLTLKDYVPPDAICTLYVDRDIKLFEGVSRDCVKTSVGNYTLTALEFTEILKPNYPKGGLILAGQDWSDVQLQYLVSSDKPTDNNDTVGLLYMANSAIPYEYFEEHDETNHIYKWEYEGAAFTITEVFQDETALTSRVNAVALESASGWYHDSSNKILYVRCTDDTHPYYHALTVPNIWDGVVPIRIGNIKDQATTTITYHETSPGDSPMEDIINLLYSLGLEWEPVVRGGYCYIDIAEQVGSGSVSIPANTYREGENILNISKIEIADARYSVNGVIFRGYGSGAGGIFAGKHRNMGRGGRFAVIEDSATHSTDTAEGYATEYLDEMYLPAKRVEAVVPLKYKDKCEIRNIGDTVRFILDSNEHFDHEMRIQKLNITLNDGLTAKIIAGDRLTTYQQRLEAMKKEAEKYRRHLQDQTETFNWSWQENLDDGITITEKFTIKDEALTIQSLTLTCTTDFFRADTPASVGGGGMGGGGGGGASGNTQASTPHHHHLKSDAKTEANTSYTTVNISTHTHQVGTLVTEATAATAETVASSTHTHPSGGISVDANTSSSSVASTSPNTDCCTGVNCGKQFITSLNSTFVASSGHAHTISGTIGASETTAINVAPYTHTHGISGSTGGPNDGETVDVAAKDHDHSVKDLETTDEDSSGHTHPMPDTNPYCFMDDSEDPTRIVPNPSDKKLSTSVENVGTYLWEKMGLLSGSDPEMYLTITITDPDGTETEINGSPFVIQVRDSIGAVLIDDIVDRAGEYTISAGLENKTEEGKACRIRMSIQIQGNIFVDSIVS